MQIIIWVLICIFIIIGNYLLNALIYEYIRDYVIQNQRKDIRWVKNEIEDAFIEAESYNHKILIRTPNCKPYQIGGIHIAQQGDKQIICIDLKE